MQQTRVPSLSWKDPLEKGLATHSSILAWRIPWTGELGGLQSMGLQSQTQLRDWTTMMMIWAEMVPLMMASPVLDFGKDEQVVCGAEGSFLSPGVCLQFSSQSTNTICPSTHTSALLPAFQEMSSRNLRDSDSLQSDLWVTYSRESLAETSQCRELMIPSTSSSLEASGSEWIRQAWSSPHRAYHLASRH